VVFARILANQLHRSLRTSQVRHSTHGPTATTHSKPGIAEYLLARDSHVRVSRERVDSAPANTSVRCKPKSNMQWEVQQELCAWIFAQDL
jgi:hypothetical protein